MTMATPRQSQDSLNIDLHIQCIIVAVRVCVFVRVDGTVQIVAAGFFFGRHNMRACVNYMYYEFFFSRGAYQSVRKKATLFHCSHWFELILWPQKNSITIISIESTALEKHMQVFRHAMHICTDKILIITGYKLCKY